MLVYYLRQMAFKHLTCGFSVKILFVQVEACTCTTWQWRRRNCCHFLFFNFSQSHHTSGLLPADTIFTHIQTDAEIQNKALCHFLPKITSQFCCLFSIDHRHFAANSHFSKLLSPPASSPSSPPLLGWKQELQTKTEQNRSRSSAFALIVISNTCSSLFRLC